MLNEVPPPTDAPIAPSPEPVVEDRLTEADIAAALGRQQLLIMQLEKRVAALGKALDAKVPQ